MRKIFTIASYDFKRLILNPISAAAYVLLLVAMVIMGFTIKIPTTEQYCAQINGTNVTTIYTNFKKNTYTEDTQAKLDQILDNTQNILTIQSSESCSEFEELGRINLQFDNTKTKIEKYKKFNDPTYSTSQLFDRVTQNTTDLENFVKEYKNLSEFQTKLVFTNDEFEKLENILNTLKDEISKPCTNTEHIDNIYKNICLYEHLNSLISEVSVWTCDNEILSHCQTQYIDVANAKKDSILTEIENYAEVSHTNEDDATTTFKSLMTNYKLTCESAKTATLIDLRNVLEKHYGNLNNLYGYAKENREEQALKLTKSQYFLKDDSLYYKAHQSALNFNTASYEVTLYDHAYFMTSIIGFLTIIFGIYCAYKLFGRDRRVGKIDTLLSKNVTFGQVFAGKVLAIIFSTSFLLLMFASISLLWGSFFYARLPGEILTTFNLSTVYSINPILFFLIKIVGIELQAIFYIIMTVFIMNLSRKFELGFVVALVIFALATVCNIYLNGSIVYCLFPFIHADLTSFLGGATMQTGFLKTSLYTYGNFFISLAYYLVVTILLFNFTKQLFKKN